MSAVFYVAAPSADDACDHLREQIKKYFFKAKLSNKGSEGPHSLGANILVDGFLSESVASSKTTLDALDITAMAYVHKEMGREGWEKFEIDLEDVSLEA